MSIKYDRKDYDIGALDPHWADVQLIRFVGQSKKVLEVGCATGYMGKYLKEKCGCELYGIELESESVKVASPYYKKVILGDVGDEKTLKDLDGEKFDVILCSNILEHTIHPETILKNLKPFLKDEGYFVVALPNIAHWSIRFNLLFGRFNYGEKGILDEAHLRFYTLKTARELLESSGLRIESWVFDWDNGIPKLDGLIQRIPIFGPRVLRYLYSLSPTLFGYQFIFKTSSVR